MPSQESSASTRPVAILIVAYRSPALLEIGLLSAHRELPGCQIYVWDNSGPSGEESSGKKSSGEKSAGKKSAGDVRDIAGRYPDVHWYFSDENIGFAAAVNKLADLVPTQDMLLLNPDAELSCPLALTMAALRLPGTAAAAPMVDGAEGTQRARRLFSRSPEPWDVAHRKLTLLNAVGTAAGLGERLRGTPVSNLYRRQPGQVNGYLTGACLAISRAAWDAVGPFDEEFFLYGEEADWQQRATARGWRIRLAPEIGVRHRAMGTVAGDQPAARRSVDLLRANQALLLEHRHGRWAADLFLAWISAADILRRAVYRRRLRAGAGLLLTIDGTATAVAQRVAEAGALARAGHPVTVVALQRLGDLPRRLPPRIRLVRGAWWWPSVTPEGLPRTLVTAVSPTRRERVFARLFLLRSRGHTAVDLIEPL